MRIAGILFVLVVLVGCNKKHKKFKEISEGGLTVQLLQVQSSEQIKYQLRIFPDKDLMSKAGLQNKMWYNMDSCFYLHVNNNKIFPSVQEPVANGVAGSFEYMLLFENSGSSNPELVFTYQDKHLNHQSYKFELN